MNGPLILSIFPGIDLLGLAFEQEWPEACVVRGPDLLWGGDVRRFHPPAGKFDGVIGGPPCQRFSPLAQASRMGLQPLADDLIPEFVRVIEEAAPTWWLMENVRGATTPSPKGYAVTATLLNNRWLGEAQNRLRNFWFGHLDGAINPWKFIELAAFDALEVAPCVTANGTQWERGVGSRGGRSRSDRSMRALKDYIRWQGLPADFLLNSTFTVEGKVRVVGNGVPLPMGRAIAKAVRSALGHAPAPPFDGATPAGPARGEEER